VPVAGLYDDLQFAAKDEIECPIGLAAADQSVARRDVSDVHEPEQEIPILIAPVRKPQRLGARRSAGGCTKACDGGAEARVLNAVS
jgi:hypothetical protein